MGALTTALVVLAVVGGVVLVLLFIITLIHFLVCLSDVWLTWLGKRARWLR